MLVPQEKIKKLRKKKVSAPVVPPRDSRITRELTDIYQNPDGSLPDMHHIEKRKRSFATRIFGGLVLLAFLGALGAGAWFFVFDRPTGSPTTEVMLEIIGMPEAHIGQEVEYRIRYRNMLDTAFTSARIELKYPAGFVVEETSLPPTDEKLPIWELGRLAPDARGSIDIRGTMYGNLDQEQSLRAFLHYEPENFSSTFQQVATFITKLTASPAGIVLEAPTSTVSGSPVPITLLVTQEIPDVSPDVPLMVSLESNGNFQITTSDPAVAEGAPTRPTSWIIDPSKKETKIQLTGIFSGDAGTQQLTARLVGAHKQANEPQQWAAATQEVAIEKADLSLTLLVNGGTEDTHLAPKETLSIRVVLKNNGATEITNAAVTLDIDAPANGKKSIFDWNEIDDAADGDIVGEQLSETMRRGRLTWNKNHVETLSALGAGKEVAFDIQLPIVSGEFIDLSTYTAHTGVVKSSVSFLLQGTEKTIAADEVGLTFTDDLSLEVSDEQKTLNNKSVHTVTWLLTHSYHALKQMTVEADLYGEVTLLESTATVPAGKLTYDATSKHVVWTIDEMPVSLDVLALTLPIQIDKENPSQKNLTSKVKIKATDVVTGTELFIVGDEVLLIQ